MKNHSTYDPGQKLRDALDATRIGRPRSDGRLSLWPLTRKPGDPEPGGLEYIPLGEALEKGRVVVDEISSGGSVPEVRVRNQCEAALLILFGEEIRGAKQNRIANATFLIPPLAEVVLDVSCVEQGRWSRGHDALRFDGVGSVVSHALRRRMSRDVTIARAAGRGYRADQAEVWHQVEDRLEQSKAASPTSSYADHMRARSAGLRKIRRHIPRVQDQVGFVAAIDGQIVGIELIGRPDVFAACYPQLLDAYAIDAVDSVSAGEATERQARSRDRMGPEGLLARLREAAVSPGASIGLGEDLRLQDPEVEGCALVAGDLIHLTAAPSVA